MSDRPQTTRNKIMCIMNTDNAQIMFLDTPGIHKPQHKLGQYMVRAAESTLHEVDVVLFIPSTTRFAFSITPYMASHTLESCDHPGLAL